MKKVLITGGFGFVGGRLAVYLESIGYRVYIASRSSGAKTSFLKNGEVVHLDWNDSGSLLSACLDKDFIIHAAGMNAAECADSPNRCLEFNGVMSGKLAKVASRTGVKKFIYLSTAHVYNGNLSGVINEESALQNTHPYATSKVAGEENIMKAHKKDSMQCVIVRIANAFGCPVPKEANCWMLFVNDLCKQASIHRKVVIKSPSNTIRNFITLSDVCTAIECILCLRFNQDAVPVVNLGDKSKSLYEMATCIQKIYHKISGEELPILELSSNDKISRKLEYRSNLINQNIWKASSNFEHEIEDLLVYCKLNFG